MNRELVKRIISSLILIPITFFFIQVGSIYFKVFTFFCFIIIFIEWYKLSENNILRIIGFLFLVISFFSIIQIRNDSTDQGFYLICFILIVCVSSDLGGYIFGKIFNGPKLTKISPNKTYSGVLGSYLLSIFLGFFYIKIFDIEVYLIKSDHISVIVLIFVLSTVNQLGDLVISFFKRLSKVKNTGKLIPGHGGLLDRVDGIIFVFPFIFLMFNYIFS